MQITSLEQLQAIKQTEIVELPSFEDGTPLVVEIKKPNMMKLLTSGKIPNTLLSVATEMFNGKTGQVMGKASEDVKTLKELVGMMEVLAEASLVNPSYKDIKKIVVTDKFIEFDNVQPEIIKVDNKKEVG